MWRLAAACSSFGPPSGPPPGSLRGGGWCFAPNHPPSSTPARRVRAHRGGVQGGGSPTPLSACSSLYLQFAAASGAGGCSSLQGNGGAKALVAACGNLQQPRAAQWIPPLSDWG
eukprot:13649914-Alexandrium_andersonii.AAC.1